MNETVFRYIVIGVASLLVILLRVRGDIFMYINPRYDLFTFVFALIGLLISIAGIGQELFRKGLLESIKASVKKLDLRSASLYVGVGVALLLLSFSTTVGFFLLVMALLVVKMPDWSRRRTLEVLVVVFLVVGLTVSPRLLSANDASSVNTTNRVSLGGGAAQTLAETFSYDSTSYDIGDWLKRLAGSTDKSIFAGETVNLTGFVYNHSDMPAGYFMLARFIISCCAVDAAPVGFLVKADGWQSIVKEDQWIRVKGTFRLEELGGESNIVVEPQGEFEGISIPDQPYIY
ncbi:MAG: TIGR03943 family protein [Candidatus Doudnabacteria bacterium]|nr:TIGR03943 family protein [Candidatus Doudnabacteria bacterium]